MNLKFPSYQFEWLTELQDNLSVHETTPDFESFDMGIPKHLGVAKMHSEKLPLGMTLFHGTHKFTREARGTLIPLTKFEGKFPELTLSVQLAYGGQFFHHENIPQKSIVIRPGSSLFRYSDKMDLTAYLDGSDDSEMIGVSIPRTSLDLLMGEEDVAILLNALKLNVPPALEIHKISSAISSIMMSALSSHLVGRARKLHIQGKILEFLSALHNTVSSKELGMAVDKSIGERVKEYLLSLNGKIATLDEISVEFKLSARYLNQAFQNEYNETIASFLSNHRLVQAKLALEKTQTPMKVISANLGYSHVNHFITAFRRKFGYPPGALRR
jgi:AraC-like DNA-binding protein